MKRVLFVFGALMVLFMALACGGGESPETGQGKEPQTIVKEAIGAMEDLRSYRQEMRFGEAEASVVIEFAAPDSYHFLWQVVRATPEMEEVEGLYETILSGEKAYSRQCKDIDEGCGSWQESPRSPVAIAGPSPSFLPGWPLVALEMAGDLRIIGKEKRDGISATRLQGRVNHIRAILETERRVFTAAGISSFGEECTVPVNGEEECRRTTYEEYLAQQEPTLSFYDQNPSTLDAWISEDGLLRLMELRITADEPDGEKGKVTVEYSHFNEVVIEPPG